MNTLNKLTFYLFLQYVIVTLILMALYHGGNYFNHDAANFILDQNYLSDLGRSVVFNGASNPSYIFYTITLSFVGIAVALYFYLITHQSPKRIKVVIWIVGLFSGLCYSGIALNPVNESLQWHLIFGRYSFFAFFFASIGSHFLLDKKRYPLSNKLLNFLNGLLFLYLLLMLFGPPSSTGVWVLQLKTIAQKVVVYSLMVCCLLIINEHNKVFKINRDLLHS